MELIEVAGLALGADGHTAVVAHSLTSLTRGLEPDEDVVLLSGVDYRAARVREVSFELTDTVYTFDLGVRLPEDLALERVRGLAPDRADAELHEIVDLLGELRDRRSDESRAGAPLVALAN